LKAGIHLIAGSTGAGKTTYSIDLARRERALRLSIDEWMTTLFEADQPADVTFEWMLERVERCEAKMWAVAQETCKLGVAVVADCGFTTVEQRSKWSRWAREAGIPVRLHHLDVGAEERWRRVEQRNRERGETFRLEVTRPMFDFVETMWEPPTPDEVAAINGPDLDRSPPVD
jgi:predicted kinase